jgi:hypothetical protein
MVKKMAFNKRKYLKKCKTCGKAEMMTFCQKNCYECKRKKNKNGVCSICGRRSMNFRGRKQTEPNICSFCREGLKHKREHVSKNLFCLGCGVKITRKEATKYVGYCNDVCHETSELIEKVFNRDK